MPFYVAPQEMGSARGHDFSKNWVCIGPNIIRGRLTVVAKSVQWFVYVMT